MGLNGAAYNILVSNKSLVRGFMLYWVPKTL